MKLDLFRPFIGDFAKTYSIPTTFDATKESMIREIFLGSFGFARLMIPILMLVGRKQGMFSWRCTEDHPSGGYI